MKREHESQKLASTRVAEFENKPIEKLFLQEIEHAYYELKKLLPHLPPVMNLYFGTNYDYGDDGVTGSAISADSMKIGIMAGVNDRTKQHDKIRPLIFHEGYHIAQGFHLGGQFSALDSAIYEGCATIFEHDYAQSTPKWGDYSKEDESTLLRWYDKIKTITAEQYFEPSGETWKKWAFYDPETEESWRVYKLGVWLVEKILNDTELTIIELSSMTAAEILSRLK